MEKYLYFKDTPIGKIGIAEEKGKITEVFLEYDVVFKQDYVIKKTQGLEKAFREIMEYLDGNRTTFDLEFSFKGSEFQQKVWNHLKEIPYGTLKSYEEIATILGNPKGARAVGLAAKRNPLPIFIPCHRVIGKGGALTGYRGGMKMKEWLINLEKRNCNLEK